MAARPQVASPPYHLDLESRWGADTAREPVDLPCRTLEDATR